MDSLSIFDAIPNLLEFLERGKIVIERIASQAAQGLHYRRAWHSLDTETLELFELIRPSIEELMSEEWRTLESYADGGINRHVLRMLVCMASTEEFHSASDQDKSILLWATLLHDMAKLGPPVIEGKDPLHPFTSCAVAIEILGRRGWFSNYSAACQLLRSSYIVKYGLKFMDNTRLREILSHLYALCGVLESEAAPWPTFDSLQRRENPKLEILLLVLFHQSVSAVLDYPAFTPISKQELREYMSPRLLKLLEVIMRCDTLSYLVLDSAKSNKFRAEVSSSFRLLNKAYNKRCF